MLDYTFIAFISFLASLVTSISGGGGVFALPAMIAYGIPPLNALALNRLSDIGVLIGAIRNYVTIKQFNFKFALRLAIPVVIGAVIGAFYIVSIPQDQIRVIVLIASVIGIGLLLFPTKQLNVSKVSGFGLGYFLMFFVGIWDGLIAMAGATFFIIVVVKCFNKEFLTARASQIVAAVPETLISAGILFWHASIDWESATIMVSFSIVGAYLGSKLAILKGNDFIKKSVIAIAILLIIRIIFDYFI